MTDTNELFTESVNYRKQLKTIGIPGQAAAYPYHPESPRRPQADRLKYYFSSFDRTD
ncbi:hypothetical protein OAE97_02180 [Verrucomicrobia bacterium]|nr:hypothetical protein [Verrucomicrobiota bacterium]